MNPLLKKLSALAALLMLGAFLISPSIVFAGQFKNKLTDANWIILQIPIPFPGCSNAALKDFVKCCDDPDIQNYYVEKNSALAQTYKSFAPICPSGSVAAVKDIPSFVLVAIQFLTVAIIIMMVLIMMFAGIQYLTSMGSSAKAHKSLELLKHSAFGLIIVLFSSVILYQVNPKLLTLSIPTPKDATLENLIVHCPQEGTTKCGEKVKGNDTCIGRKCDTGNYCAEAIDDKNVSSFKCSALIELGNPCVSNEECKTAYCAAGTVDPSKKICTNIESILRTKCKTNAECPGLICLNEGGYDVSTNAGINAQCSFGHQGNGCKDNSQCDAAAGYICLSSHICSVAQVPYGQCGRSADCQNGYVCGQGVFDNTFTGELYGSDNGIDTCLPPSKTIPGERTKVTKCDSNDDCKSSPFGTPFCSGDRVGLYYCSLGLVGSPCTDGRFCASGYCFYDSKNSRSSCTNGAVGDACTTAKDCASKYCFTANAGLNGYCITNPSGGNSVQNSTTIPTQNQPQQ